MQRRNAGEGLAAVHPFFDANLDGFGGFGCRRGTRIVYDRSFFHISMRARVLSGIQPTGSPHIGNYLGALKNWAKIQYDYESIYCIVDLHAITVFQDPKELTRNTREVAAGMIAFLGAGLCRYLPRSM